MVQASIPADFLAFAVQRMQLSAKDIYACVDRLTAEQMWHREGDYENSVANLLLHLEGNMRQWILHGIDGQPDIRQRDEEFALVGTVTAPNARSLFAAAIDECSQVVANLPHERLLEVIDPQPNGTWRNPTILEAVFQVTAHIQQHMGQIVILTKQLTHSDLDLSMPRKR